MRCTLGCRSSGARSPLLVPPRFRWARGSGCGRRPGPTHVRSGSCPSPGPHPPGHAWDEATRVDRAAIPGDGGQRCTAERLACEVGRCPTGAKAPAFSSTYAGAPSCRSLPPGTLPLNGRAPQPPTPRRVPRIAPFGHSRACNKAHRWVGAMGGRCGVVGSPCPRGHDERDQVVSPVRCGPGGR